MGDFEPGSKQGFESGYCQDLTPTCLHLAVTEACFQFYNFTPVYFWLTYTLVCLRLAIILLIRAVVCIYLHLNHGPNPSQDFDYAAELKGETPTTKWLL